MLDVQNNNRSGPVNQHYIPQFVLRNWVGCDNKMVRFRCKCQLDDGSFVIQKNHWKIGSSAAFCFERYGYEISEDASVLPYRLEDSYGKLESKIANTFYPNLITKVLPNSEGHQLVLMDSDERLMLKLLVSMLYIRMPLLQSVVKKDVIPVVMDDVLKDKDMQLFLSQYPDYFFVDVFNKYFEKMVFLESVAPDFLDKPVVRGSAMRDFFNILDSMDFFFVKSMDASLVFGDNYVLRLEHCGELVFMPFTSEYGVVFIERGLIPYSLRNRLCVLDKNLESLLMLLVVSYNIDNGYAIYGSTKSSVQDWVSFTHERYPFVFEV